MCGGGKICTTTISHSRGEKSTLNFSAVQFICSISDSELKEEEKSERNIEYRIVITL